MKELNLKSAVLTLVAFAQKEGIIPVEGAWRISARSARRLTKHAQGEPAGTSWEKVASLAAGACVYGRMDNNFLKATRAGFEPGVQAAQVADLSDAEIQIAMLESFTVQLVPPSLAAGMFITVMLHPAWGLRIAHGAHKSIREEVTREPVKPANPGWEDETLFPQAVSEIGQDLVFSYVEDIVEHIKGSGGKLDSDDFVGYLKDTAEGLHKLASEPNQMPGLDLVLSEAGRPAQCRAFAKDLLDEWLIPAGIATVDVKDSSWNIDVEAFEAVHVRNEHRGAIERYTTLEVIDEAARNFN